MLSIELVNNVHILGLASQQLFYNFNAHSFGKLSTMIDGSQMGSVEPRLSASSHAGISPIPQGVAHCDNNGTKEASTSVYVASEVGVDNEATMRQPTTKKPINFYLAFFAINIACFIFSLDSTSLSVAIPVSHQLSSPLPSIFVANFSSPLPSSFMAQRFSLSGLASPFFLRPSSHSRCIRACLTYMAANLFSKLPFSYSPLDLLSLGSHLTCLP